MPYGFNTDKSKYAFDQDVIRSVTGDITKTSDARSLSYDLIKSGHVCTLFISFSLNSNLTSNLGDKQIGTLENYLPASSLYALGMIEGGYGYVRLINDGRILVRANSNMTMNAGTSYFTYITWITRE